MQMRGRVIKRLLLACCCFGFIPGLALADETAVVNVRFPQAESELDQRYHYPGQLLKLALELTRETHGRYQLEPVPALMNQKRILNSLENGALDIAPLPNTQTHLNHITLDFVPIPLHKGLLGWRLLLIHNDDAPAFANIDSLADLQAFRAGYKQDWGDADVMQHNFPKLLFGSDYNGLFSMLQAGRFDFLSRAVHEIWDERVFQRRRAPDMVVEQRLALRYPAYDFFFVAPGKLALRDRVEEGLRMAIADGSFDDLFHLAHGEPIRKAELEKRTVIELSLPRPEVKIQGDLLFEPALPKVP